MRLRVGGREGGREGGIEGGSEAAWEGARERRNEKERSYFPYLICLPNTSAPDTRMRLIT